MTKQVLLVFAAILASMRPCSGQTANPSLTGIVTDPSGAVLVGATITATRTDTGVAASADSNRDGNYTIIDLRPGAYRLRTGMAGFKTDLREGIVLEMGQVGRIDIRLQVGEVSEQVVVSAGTTPLLHTEVSSQGSVITNEEVTDLPLESRNYQDLAFLTAGVAPAEDKGVGFASANGSRPSEAMNFIVEGGTNRDARRGFAQVSPTVDAIQEFKMQTSSYTAETGGTHGGAINVYLKSGTNSFHGALYDYFRNDAIDARSFFATRKSELRQNHYGGTLGGPVIRNQTFFFGSYDGLRTLGGLPHLVQTPTAPQRQGDFSELTAATYRLYSGCGNCGGVIKDPLNGNAPFPGNIIPQPRWNPVGAKALSYYPLPNIAGAPLNVPNYYTNLPPRAPSTNYIGKIDQYLPNGDSISLRALVTRSMNHNPYPSSGNSFYPGFGTDVAGGQEMFGANINHLFRPALVNQTRLSFSRTTNDSTAADGGTNWAQKLGISGTTTVPGQMGFPNFVVRGYNAFGDYTNVPVHYVINNFNLGDTLSWMVGTHNVRIGTDIIRSQYFYGASNNSNGTFDFEGNWTGNSVADLLLGLPQTTTRSLNFNKNYLFMTSAGAFVQDDWKIRRDLTLNLGIRYDVFTPPYDKFNHWSEFYPPMGKVLVGGDPGIPRALVNTWWNNFEPRVGLAWRPFGSRKYVVRSAYGLFGGATTMDPYRQQLGVNEPWTLNQQFSRNTSQPTFLTMSNPFPDQGGKLTGTTAGSGFQMDPKTPTVQHWNFSLERQFGKDMVLEASYVGSKGTHLGMRYDANQAYYSPDGTFAYPQPFAGYSTMAYFVFNADSSYNSGQITLQKRGRDFNFRINYWYSKSLDNGSRYDGTAQGGITNPVDSYDWNLERGLSDFDRRQGFVATVLYHLPFGKMIQSRWLRGVAGGWQATAIYSAYSGTPFTPQTNTSNSDLPGYSKRPDRIGSGKLADPTVNMWFNLADFMAVPIPTYRYGTSGRNILIGPGRQNLNCSLIRDFTVPHAESHHIQLRIESFNALNHANFRVPEPRIDVATAGLITQSAAGREMQLALRYTF